MKTNISIVMRIKSINDLMMTPITIAIDLSARNTLVTLRTRNVRNTLTVLNVCRLFAPPPPPKLAMIISIIDKHTTPPSSKFIVSETYFLGPRARIRIVISTMKIHVKISFMNSILLCVSGVMEYESIAIPTVFARTIAVSALSKMLSRMIYFKRQRNFFIALWKPLGQTRIMLKWLTTILLFSMFSPK